MSRANGGDFFYLSNQGLNIFVYRKVIIKYYDGTGVCFLEHRPPLFKTL
jgi:hypothetical protein